MIRLPQHGPVIHRNVVQMINKHLQKHPPTLEQLQQHLVSMRSSVIDETGHEKNPSCCHPFSMKSVKPNGQSPSFHHQQGFHM